MGFRERVRKKSGPGNPPTWSPKEGDELFGTVIAPPKAVETQYGVFPRVEVECEDTGNRWTVWLAATMLRGLWFDKQPQVGERIGLIYHGKRESSRSEHDYNAFTLEVDRATESNRTEGAR